MFVVPTVPTQTSLTHLELDTIQKHRTPSPLQNPRQGLARSLRTFNGRKLCDLRADTVVSYSNVLHETESDTFLFICFRVWSLTRVLRRATLCLAGRPADLQGSAAQLKQITATALPSSHQLIISHECAT
eukprot:1187778-Prorocentrum_minimum.AAC.6